MTTTGISIPCLLSFLAYQDFQATVAGLETFPPQYWAPINTTFQVYHLMVNLGGLFVLISLLLILYYFRGRRLFNTRWLLWVLVISIVLTELATLSGWWTAEFGRQPWIVWEVLLTADAVSPNLTTGQLIFSVLSFVLLYALLFVLFLFLLNHKIQHGPDPLSDMEDTPVSSLPDSFREIFGRRPRASS
jgi:cytochrome d ubiquinol oxidase subunit I